MTDRLIELISKNNIVNEFPWIFLELIEALISLHEKAAIPYLKIALEQINLEYYENDEMDRYELLINNIKDAIKCLSEE